MFPPSPPLSCNLFRIVLKVEIVRRRERAKGMTSRGPGVDVHSGAVAGDGEEAVAEEVTTVHVDHPEMVTAMSKTGRYVQKICQNRGVQGCFSWLGAQSSSPGWDFFSSLHNSVLICHR